MTLFSKIMAGEIPCFQVDETDKSFAFLALHQVQKGHTLVVPKIEVDKWTDCDPEYFTEVMQSSQRIAKAIEKFTQCPRVGTATVGFEVPHFHHHLIPMWGIGDLNFAKGQVLPDEEMQSIAAGIRNCLT